MPVRRTVAAFRADLEAFARQIDSDLGTVKRKIALDLFAKLTDRTPVDTGRARASWAMSDDAPSTFVQPPGKKKGEYPDQGPITSTFQDPYAAAWIVNRLPYIERLEFGHSPKSPHGMVRIAVAEIQAEMASARGPVPGGR